MREELFTKERIQNMGVFFLQNTLCCDLQKLLKLYYFSDREAYLATGLTMTGMDYFAREKGPVPDKLAGAIGGWLPDTYDMESVIMRNDNGHLTLQPEIEFRDDFFSERELEILNTIKDQYCPRSAEELSEASHQPGLPWSRVWEGGDGDGILIDFSQDDVIIDNNNRREIIEYVRSSVKKFQDSAALL